MVEVIISRMLMQKVIIEERVWFDCSIGYKKKVVLTGNSQVLNMFLQSLFARKIGAKPWVRVCERRAR